MTDDLSDNMMKLMGISVPVLVYNPTGHFDISLVSSAYEAGALGIMDAEHLGPDGIKEALTSLKSTGAPFGVRLNPMSDSLMALMGEGLPEGLRAIISTPKEGIPEMVRQGVYDTAHSMNLKVLQEVCSAEEAAESSKLGADGIVIRGSETGGRASPLKALELFNSIKKDCGSTPILIKGGITLTNAREMLEKGISGLVMGEQVYTIGASPLSDALKVAIRSCTKEGFFQVGSSVDRVFSGYCPDRKVREELLSMESSMADGSTDRKEAYKAIRSEMNNRGGAGFTDDKGASPFLLMGTDGLMAKEFEKVGNLGSIVSSMFGEKERSEVKVSRKGGTQMSDGETTVDGRPVTSDYYDRSIAIVGIGTVFPKGIGLDNYWNMIMNGVDACDEIPIDRFDWKLHYDPDPTVKDRMYTKLGAFIRELDFNSFDYKIPPKVAEQIDHYQRFELVASKEALMDAGMYQNKDIDRERVGVIIANSGGGENRDWCAIRVGIEEVQQYASETETWKELPKDAREALFSQIRDKIDDNIIPINEDTMPGSLPNIASGRVANVFGFSGPNFITDAACASTLAAISTARDNLILGRMDICVSGGTDSSMTAQGFVEFCKIGALTPDGSRPFSKGANGFLMGEGSGILILKRLDDAVRDGDKIYAVIKGVGGSSDGKGKGITAPNPRGQTLAVNRAVEDAGVDLSTISFVEAHGTSTSVGDVAELVGLMETFKGLPQKSIGLTSVKSQIGHLKAAAGAAGLIKAVMAIKNKTLPPQINFAGPNPYFEWEKSPFYVITESGKWDRISPDIPRRCGVSAFGFGGTNFHIVVEEFDGSIYTAYQKAKEAKPTATTSFEEEVKIEREVDERSIAQYLEKRGDLESEVFMFSSENPLDLLSQADKAALRIEEAVSNGGRVRDALLKPSYEGRYRLSIVAGSKEELTGKIEALKKAGMNEKALLVLRAKGIFIGDRSRIELGKVCFMFPGQGSQYLNMFRDLHAKYSIVRDVFSEADGVMKDLIPKPLSSFVFTDEVRGTDAFKEAQETLRQTEFNQPSMLTADTSMYKMLLALGVSPDLVVGHSLGEYGALIASGVLTFEGALQAVSARGKEMRDLKVEDPGKMASVSAGLDKVEEVLKGIDGYVIAANKNCYVQTVIAGENKPMEEAVKRFKEEGIEAVFIPVSHAFHSSVVAPAKEPLRRFLSNLDIRTPTIPLLSNVTADYYPTEGTPEEIKEQVLDLLKEQVASSVEWMAQIKRARKDGCNVFIEVGPKRALSSFAYNILEDEVKAGKAFPLLSNHPKKGGIATFNEMVGSLWSLGFDLKFHDLNDETYYNSDFSHAFDGFVKEREIRTQKPMASIEPAPTSRAEMVAPGKDADPGFASFLNENSNALNDFLSAVYKKLPKGAPALEEVRDDVDLSGSGTTPPTRKGVGVVITGAAMGLPGKFKSVFSEDNLNLLVSGRNLIEKIEPEYIPRFIEKNIVRLDKKADGSAEMIKLDNGEKVAHLAGMLGDFDLGKEFDIPEDLVKHLDITTRLAFASGLLALKDAGIPLVRRYSQTSTGSFLPESWELPLEMQEDTGIVFATAFPGYDMLFGQIAQHMEMKISKARGKERERLYGHLKKVVKGTELEGELEGWHEEALKDPQAEYQFPRHFMFIVLAMGHSQFAQFLKAKGPNTQVNSACASSTLAVAIGQDWIQAGRCKRVLVLGADDPSSDNSLEWLGSSLLSLGALTTESDVTKAALPFDRRRKGMIIGSGAAALVLEAEEEPRRRGMNPLVEILGTHIGNSAFHGSRLDIAHIARSMDRFMLRIERETGIKRDQIADDLIFMSHETYTPARGGSSAAEVESLRRTFGDRFRDILIMNTKGFTGHAFGACMEDPALIKALETGRSIPIANLNPSEVDKQFEGLQLSTGGTHNRRYGLRLAAGFGSQLSFLLVKRPDVEGRYISNETYQKWLDSIATTSPAQREDHPNVLRLKDQGIENLIKHRAILRGSSAIGYEKEIVAMGEDPEFNRIREEVIRIVAEKTGFEGSMLDIDSDMENELGFDTVKQVELFAAARIHFDLPKDEGVNLREYPTLRHFIEYIMIKSGNVDIKAPAPAPSEEKEVEEVVTRTGWEMVKEKVIAIVAEKTGYPEDMLELDLDLEADLGIDTVKQVELFGMARTEFDLPRDESVNLSEMPTLRHIIDYVVEGSGIKDEIQTPAAAPAAVDVPMGEGHPHWDTIRDSIVKIVAEKTGYPEDMLELDLDLEADLGIDTVKQVELFGMARTEFDLPRDESVNLSEMPTLRHIVDYVVAGVKYDAPPAAEVPMGEGHPHWDMIRESIVKIVAEKTGYPEDMLELDLDLEADLGIDTVKQVELFGMARTEFDLPRDESVNLSEMPTLRHIVDYVVAGAIYEAPDKETTKDKATVDDLKDRINRWVLQVDELPPLTEEPSKALEGKKLVVLDANRKSGEMAKRILGIDPVFASPSDLIKGKVDLSGVEGLINLYPLSMKDEPLPSKWEKVNDEAISSLFHAVKGMDAKLKEGGVFISLTAMGGKLGLDAEVNPVSGAVSGFTKGVKREYTASDVMVLDLPVGIGVEGGLKRLSVELGDSDRPLEYGWDGKNRYIPAMRIMEHSQEQINRLEDGMRILISGGGTGITAEIVKELAKSARLELHLLGRTQVSGDVERLSDLDDEGLKKEKELIKERLKDEGRKVTPVLLDREFSSITKSIAIHKLLSDVRRSGSDAFYHSLDVTDAKGIKKMVKKAGKFDGIIHGAGVEQSKLISAKTKEDFDRVYNTKVMGAHALIMATKDHPLKFFISFTSVAGRFGNAGQVDYSAANDLLDKLHGAVTSIHPDCLVKAVGWSAWADVGMASRGSVKTILEIGGITFIPVEDGVRYGIDEILYGDEREVYYSGSLGPMDSEKLMRWEEGVHKAPSVQEKGYAPLLDSMIEEGDGFALYERRLDGVRERFLPDHSIMGTMVMPGVMGMEVFAEAASKLLPDMEFLGLESVSFRKPVNVKGSTTFRVSAKIEGVKKGVTRISLDLVSDDPRKEGKRIEHYVGTALMGSREGVKNRIEGHPIRPGSVQARILRDEIYKHMFHGDRFRVLSGIDVLKDGELLGTYNRVPDDLFDPSTSFTPGDLISVPMQSEAGFQAAGAYVMDRFHMMALPTKVERLMVHRWMRSDELASVWVRFIENVDNTYTFDFDILDVDGNVTVSVGGYELKALMPFQEGFEGDHSLKFEELEGPFEEVRVFRIEVGSLKAEHDSYSRYFSDKEWSSIKWEKMADKRKLEHLAGRVISKLGLTWVEATDKGVSLPLSSATIIVSQGGKPSGLIGGDERNISISHSRRWAICSVSEGVHGIDLELAEPRDPSFDEEAFTKEEMELMGSVVKDLSISPEEAKTLIFSAKEAVLKMFGEGLGENITKVTGLDIKRITSTTFALTMKFGSREHLVQAHMVGAYVLSLCGEDKQ